MNNYINIDTVQLAEILKHKKVLILDVRKNEDFKTGHIKNAKNYDLESLESKINQLKPYRRYEVVVYCTSGVKSINASMILCKNGFTKVYNLVGGISKYNGDIVESKAVKK